MRWLPVLPALLMLAGCPDLKEGVYACTADSECPDGWTCRQPAGRCYRDPVDAAVPPLDGSSNDAGPDAGPLTRDAGPDAGPPCEAPNAVDVLLVIDDSGSMEEEQDELIARFPGFVDELIFAGVTDLHVGVVSTDMGTGSVEVRTCDGSDFGSDALMRTQSGDSCVPADDSFLRFDPDDSLGEFRRDFTCSARLGTSGCGIEQQLEAMLKAVTPATSDTRFHMSSTGHGDGANAGFLRDDALLVVVVVTDESDCSVADPTLFTNTSISPNLWCLPENGGEYLHPFTRYVDGLRALKGNDVIFAPLAGIPEDLAGAPIRRILDDERLEIQVDESNPERLVASCEGEGGRADPPRRILEVAGALETLGGTQVTGSICADDYGDFFRDLADAITPRLDRCD